MLKNSGFRVEVTIFGRRMRRTPRPYSILESTDSFQIRSFRVDAPSEEYVWHRDKETREVEVLSGEGWRIQFENCLPALIKPGLKFTIPVGEYHRVIPGATALICRISFLYK